MCTYTVTVAYYLSQSEIGTRFSNLLSNVSYKQLDIVSRRRYKTTDLTTLSVDWIGSDGVAVLYTTNAVTLPHILAYFHNENE